MIISRVIVKTGCLLKCHHSGVCAEVQLSVQLSGPAVIILASVVSKQCPEIKSHICLSEDSFSTNCASICHEVLSVQTTRLSWSTNTIVLDLTVISQSVLRDKDSLIHTCRPQQRVSNAIPTREWRSHSRSRTSVKYNHFLGIVQ